MPRGVRETRFYVIEESKKGKPTVRSFATTPEFKEWLAESGISLSKGKKKSEAMWCEAPDGRWVLIFKGHNVAAFQGQMVKA